MRIDQAKMRHVTTSVKSSPTDNTRPSVFTEKFRGEYYNIDIDKLIPFQNQARRYFDEESISQLAETIKAHGIRQPLTIIQTEDFPGKYEVVSGERRLRAAIVAGLKTVPCIIMDDRQKAEEVAIIENIQRKNLHPLELAQAYSNLLTNKVCNTSSEIAKKVGASRTTVVEILALLNLNEKVQERLLKSQLKQRTLLRALSKLTNEEQEKYLEDFIKKDTLVEDKNTRPKRRKSFQTKSQIINVVLSGDKFLVDKNRIEALDQEQKMKIKALLDSLF